MISGYTIRKNQYYDSVFLMGINKKLSENPGVKQTAVLMGTEKNKEILLDIGIKNDEISSASANDLIVAVTAETQSIVDGILADLDKILNAEVGESSTQKWQNFEEGLEYQPDSNFVVISIPGEFVYREALKALEAGLHVFIFSSNVSLEDEKKLKDFAVSKDLLVMGPDCGTSLISGQGIGFANAVRKGSIGVIGASGTGLQEFTCQVHNAGLGISQAIGTGTNDVSDQIGGITSFQAVEALEADPATEVITFISKPPGKKFQGALIKRLNECSKPAVCCFLGSESNTDKVGNVCFASTIDEAVAWARHLTSDGPAPVVPALTEEELRWIDSELEKFSQDQRYLRGIFAGGTFCYQSQKVLQKMGLEVFSNAPLEPAYKLEDPDQSQATSIVDMGDEFYTLGKPHPMIDGSLRFERILTESHDPQVAVLFLDFILGYNASADPAGELLEAINQAQQSYQQRGAHLTVVASICGTEDDSQDLKLQTQLLRDQKVIVFQSNSRAAVFCATLLKRLGD
ncbi:MAG: acyl-CoA synthetase FdrA [Chloroflexi bacterium]|nr:acyl-CoA synthetase FdrA [Chloroflexota bacterium]